MKQGQLKVIVVVLLLALGTCIASPAGQSGRLHLGKRGYTWSPFHR